MDPINIKIWNYRNTPNHTPLEFELRDGITFILGMNNIGKSNILRFFFELRDVFKVTSRYGGVSNFNVNGSVFFDEIANRKSSNDPIKIEVRIGDNLLKISLTPELSGELHTKNLRVRSEFIIPVNHNNFGEKISMLSDTLYFGGFRGVDFDFNGSTGEIAIGQKFISLWSQWAGGDDVKNRNKIEQVEDELKELLGFKRFSIKLNDAKNTLLVTTDDGLFKINELGGGVAQLVMILGNAAIKNPAFILIDEPEIGLHPRMQEVLVRALASKAKIGLIASSHSIGLARSVAENIFSLTRLPNGSMKLSPFGEHYKPTISQSINELGYSQFVEVGGNNILLVEGRTDIKAFREILRKYNIETNFIIMSFGGGEFVVSEEARIVDELNELKRLNPKSISVIFDSDIVSEKQPLSKPHQTFKDCCERLGFNVFPTDRSATENYITQAALNKIFPSSGYKQLGHYESFNKLSSGKWDKNKNWLLFREMSKADFDSSELKIFIEKILLPLA